MCIRDSIQVAGVAHGPHQLGDSGLPGHVKTLDGPFGQSFLPHLIDGKIGPFIQALAAPHHRDAGINGLFALRDKIPADELQAADAKGFNDDAVAAGLDHQIHQLGVGARRQFEQVNVCLLYTSSSRWRRNSSIDILCNVSLIFIVLTL